MTRRVLLIDFEKRSLESTRSLLEGAGYDVAAARTGAEAMASIEEIRPAVIVLEPMIPGQDGFKLCQSLKRGDHGPVPHVIVASRIYRGPKYRNMAREVGADAYLERPQQDGQLIESVARALPPEFGALALPGAAAAAAAAEIAAPEPIGLDDLLSATLAPPTAAPLPRRAPHAVPHAAPPAVSRAPSRAVAHAAPQPAGVPQPAAAPQAAAAPERGPAVALAEPELADADLLGEPAFDLAAEPPDAPDYALAFHPSDDEIESALLSVLGPDPVVAAGATTGSFTRDRGQALATAIEAQAMAVLDLTYAAEDAATGPAEWSADSPADMPLDTGFVVVDAALAESGASAPLAFDFPVARPPLPGGLEAALDRVELPALAPADAAGHGASARFEFDLLPESELSGPAESAPVPSTLSESTLSESTLSESSPLEPALSESALSESAPSESSLPSLPPSLLDGFEPTSPGDGLSDPFGGAGEPDWDRLFPPTTGATLEPAAPLASSAPSAPPAPLGSPASLAPHAPSTSFAPHGMAPAPVPAPPQGRAPENLDADLERAFAGLSFDPLPASAAAMPEPGATLAAPAAQVEAAAVEAGIEVPTGLRGMDAGTAELLSSLEELENSMPDDAPSYLESGWGGSTGLTGVAAEVEPSIPHTPPPLPADQQGLEDAIFSAQSAPDPLPPPPDWAPSRPDLEIEPLAGSPPEPSLDAIRAGEPYASRRVRPKAPEPTKRGGGLTGWLFGALALVIVASGASAAYRHLAGGRSTPAPRAAVAEAAPPLHAGDADRPKPSARRPAAAVAAAPVPRRALPDRVREIPGAGAPHLNRPRPQEASSSASPEGRTAPEPAREEADREPTETEPSAAAERGPSSGSGATAAAPTTPERRAEPDPEPEPDPPAAGVAAEAAALAAPAAAGSAGSAGSAAAEPAEPVGPAPLVRSSELDAPLRPVEAPAPALPTAAERDGALGKVYLNVLVGPDGTVRETKVMIEPGHGLGEAAREAVQRWVYTRPTRAGAPVRVWKAEVIEFHR